MLGVFLAPDGNNKWQIKEMKKKTEYLGELVRTGHLDKHEAWSSLTLVAMKSIEYPLPAFTLTEDDCTKIMWPLLKSYLPKTGVNRHFPRDILYGDPKDQGLGLRNLYLTQGISHIVDMIQHLWTNSLTGQLINQSLEHLVNVNAERRDHLWQIFDCDVIRDLTISLSLSLFFSFSFFLFDNRS